MYRNMVDMNIFICIYAVKRFRVVYNRNKTITSKRLGYKQYLTQPSNLLFTYKYTSLLTTVT